MERYLAHRPSPLTRVQSHAPLNAHKGGDSSSLLLRISVRTLFFRHCEEGFGLTRQSIMQAQHWIATGLAALAMTMMDGEVYYVYHTTVYR